MSKPAYVPPKVWRNDAASGGQFASINRPVAGPTHDKDLPLGKHPLQLYSWPRPMASRSPSPSSCSRRATRVPNMMLADPHWRGRAVLQRLRPGQPQLENPRPARPQRRAAGAGVRVGFDPAVPGRKIRRLAAESASCTHREPELAVLADGGGALLGGGFGHFYVYAPEKFEYAINRFTMEAKRQLDVLDRRGRKPLRAARNTASPTSPCGRGMASWCAATCMARRSSGGGRVPTCAALGRGDCLAPGGTARHPGEPDWGMKPASAGAACGGRPDG